MTKHKCPHCTLHGSSTTAGNSCTDRPWALARSCLLALVRGDECTRGGEMATARARGRNKNGEACMKFIGGGWMWHRGGSEDGGWIIEVTCMSGSW